MPTDSKASRPCDSSGHRMLPALGRRHWRVFPGHSQELAQMRRWLSSILPPCPARDDVLSVATEFGSNALKHTASGKPGGWFAVEVTSDQSSMQVAVADGGADAEPQVVDDPYGERGRGLMLVNGLSMQTGWTGDQVGRLVWAQIAWPDQHLVQDSCEHLPARCCCHVFTPGCPIDCLKGILSTSTFHALARAEGAPFRPPATVGQVLDLWRVGQLRLVAGLGPRRRGEIEVALVVAGLALDAPGPS